MIDFDNLPAEIDRLHAEAEEIAALAKRTEDPGHAADLRANATAKVRQAATLRAQIEDLA